MNFETDSSPNSRGQSDQLAAQTGGRSGIPEEHSFYEVHGGYEYEKSHCAKEGTDEEIEAALTKRGELYKELMKITPLNDQQLFDKLLVVLMENFTLDAFNMRADNCFRAHAAIFTLVADGLQLENK